MLKARTFPKGGVHPHGRKSLANKAAIVALPESSIVTVPMSQHLGAPAVVCVAKGDVVKVGDVIGTGESFISADIHAPVSGTVKEITSVILPNSISTKAVVIERAEDSEPAEFPFAEGDPVEQLTGEQLITRTKQAGIVGMGGATFPAHVKFQIPKGKHAEYLVINGVECEPYLTADHRTMLEHTNEVLDGIRAIAKMTSAEKVIICIENNKPDAIDAMEKAVNDRNLPFFIQPLKVKYPQGDEKQLLKAVINREVPSGGLPIEIGAVVSNVGTSYAVYEAVFRNKPLISRVVTVTGDAVKNPGNFRVTVGTPIRTLIEAAGGFSVEPKKLVAGGPMMGFSFFDLDTPVIKGTSGILALTEKNLDKAERTACISCGKCVMACPMGLQPTKLFKYIDHQRFDEAMKLNLMDCKECGCCAFSCPARIPLVHGFKYGKKMARKKQ